MAAKQGTKEWLEERRGRFTASEIYKLMGARGFGQTGETYILTKAAEIVSGGIDETPSNKNFEHGHKYEPIAAKIYAAGHAVEVSEHGLKIWEENDGAGASPDRIIEGSHGLEIKCPITRLAHLKHLRAFDAYSLKRIAPTYYWQVQMCLLCFPDLKYWDFLSYNKDYKNFSAWAFKVERVEADQNLLMERIHEAVAIRDEIVNEILNR